MTLVKLINQEGGEEVSLEALLRRGGGAVRGGQ